VAGWLCRKRWRLLRVPVAPDLTSMGMMREWTGRRKSISARLLWASRTQKWRVEFEIDFGEGDFFDAGEFADEPGFTDLPGSVEEEGFAVFAMEPGLEMAEKAPFHVLKIAIILIFSKVVFGVGRMAFCRGRMAAQ
jgi:hypothetical protein